MDEQLRRISSVSIAIFVQDHRHQIARGWSIEMTLPRIGVVPGAERTAKHNTVAIGQEHLCRATRMPRIGFVRLLLVDKPYVTDTGAYGSKLPWLTAALVVRACAKLPRDCSWVFNRTFQLMILLQELMWC